MKVSLEKKLQMYIKRDSCDGRRWMNKNGAHRRVRISEIKKFIKDGWVEGRLMKRDQSGKFMK